MAYLIEQGRVIAPDTEFIEALERVSTPLVGLENDEPTDIVQQEKTALTTIRKRLDELHLSGIDRITLRNPTNNLESWTIEAEHYPQDEGYSIKHGIYDPGQGTEVGRIDLLCPPASKHFRASYTQKGGIIRVTGKIPLTGRA